MSEHLIRCRQGHIYDAGAHATCPTCGEGAEDAESQAATDGLTGGGGSFGAKGWSTSAKPLAAGAVGAAVIVAALLVWTMAGKQPAPLPVPTPAHEPAPIEKEKSALRETEKPGTEAKPDITRTNEVSSGRAAAQTDATTAADRSSDRGTASAGQNPSIDASRDAKSANGRSTSAAASIKEGPFPGQVPKATDAALEALPAVTFPTPSMIQAQKALGISDQVLDAHAAFTLGDSLAKAPSRELAARLRRLADRGSVYAKVLLADAFLEGRGVERNDGLGMRYLREAADEGQGLARLNLAKIYLQGRLVMADREKALSLASLATREGVSGAAVVVRELGVDPASLGPIGPELNRLAMAGDPRVVGLANAFIKDKIGSGYLALSWYAAQHSKDPTLRREAAGLASKAANLLISNAFQVLDLLYEDGKLVKRNPAEAYLWLKLANKFCGQSTNLCGDQERRLQKLLGEIDGKALASVFAE